MTTQESWYSLEKAEEEASIVQRKAELLSHGERVDAANYEQACTCIDEMLEVCGTMDFVVNLLEIEEMATELGVSKEYFEVIGKLQPELSSELEKRQQELIKTLAELKAINKSELWGDAIEKFIIDYTMWDASTVMRQVYAGVDTSIILDSRLQQLAGKYLEFKSNVMSYKMNVALGGGETPPPPPPPNGGPENYENVEPENLVDIEWEGGDTLTFTHGKTMKDNEGRERSFYRATYTYTNKDTQKRQSIDLSTYTGKFILFEGTKGAITGASMSSEDRKSCGGWAINPYFTGKGASLVALNYALLLEGPKHISTVFHEIGHCVLFGNAQSGILNRPQKPLPKLQKLLRGFQKINDSQSLLGLTAYQNSLEPLRQAIYKEITDQGQILEAFKNKVGSRISLYLNDASLQEDGEMLYGLGLMKFSSLGYNGPWLMPDEIAWIRQISNKIKTFQKTEKILSSEDPINEDEFFQTWGISKTFVMERKLSEKDNLSRLASIFQERYTGAFAVRQIRALKPKYVTPKQVLSMQHSSLHAYSIINNDPRYLGGIEVRTRRVAVVPSLSTTTIQTVADSPPQHVGSQWR